MKSRISFSVLLAVLLAIFSCSKEEEVTPKDGPYKVIAPVNPSPKGDRLFGINLSTSTNGFFASFDTAKKAGIQIVELNLPWTMIETSEGNYADPDGLLSATYFYGENNIKVGLSLAVINTVKWEIPEYLVGIAVNSQQFIDAYNAMVDWVIASMPKNVDLEFISIGNEVDLVLSTDEDWADYTDFYSATANHIQTNYSGIKVGVKTTVMEGLFTTKKTKVQLINNYSDVVMLNYYPQNHQFQVLDTSIVHAHFADIVTAFPTKDIWMTELGYQSGSNLCASSELKQAHFYHNMFQAWDTQKEHIKLVLINWLFDQSPQLIEEWKEYYGNDPALVEYLSTLGLLNYDGTYKSAWLQVLEETKVRGW
ncbi:MAG TPA: hypothetical protein DDX98_14035 [Bacteroidales bacterium]|jgi:hypothetical protein|nr:hypothetical protein [Bacteroidales bacterium]